MNKQTRRKIMEWIGAIVIIGVTISATIWLIRDMHPRQELSEICHDTHRYNLTWEQVKNQTYAQDMTPEEYICCFEHSVSYSIMCVNISWWDDLACSLGNC